MTGGAWPPAPPASPRAGLVLKDAKGYLWEHVLHGSPANGAMSTLTLRATDFAYRADWNPDPKTCPAPEVSVGARACEAR